MIGLGGALHLLYSAVWCLNSVSMHFDRPVLSEALWLRRKNKKETMICSCVRLNVRVC